MHLLVGEQKSVDIKMHLLVGELYFHPFSSGAVRVDVSKSKGYYNYII